MSPSSDPTVVRMIDDRIKDLHSAIDRLVSVQHAAEINVMQLVAAVDNIQKEHIDCTKERAENTKFRREAELFVVFKNKYRAIAWTLGLLILGGILRPMLSDGYEVIKRQVIPRRPYVDSTTNTNNNRRAMLPQEENTKKGD